MSLLCVVLGGVSASVYAVPTRTQVASGKGYDLKSCPEAPKISDCSVTFLLMQYFERKADQQEVWITEYWSADRKELYARDTVETQKEMLRSYRMEQFRVGRVSVMQREEGDRFRMSRKEGDEQQMITENFSGNLTPPPLLAREVQKAWEHLRAGDSVPLELAVASDLTTYGVKLVPAQDQRRIKLVARSFFLNLFMPEIYFEIDGAKIGAWKGRVPVMRSVEGEFEDMDAFVVLDQPFEIEVRGTHRK